MASFPNGKGSFPRSYVHYMSYVLHGKDRKGKGIMATQAHPFGKGKGGMTAMGKGKGGKGEESFADTLRSQLDRLVPWLTRLDYMMSCIDMHGEDQDFNLNRLDCELKGFLSIMIECEQYRQTSFSRSRARDLSLSRSSSSSAEPNQPSADLECVVCGRPCYFCTGP